MKTRIAKSSLFCKICQQPINVGEEYISAQPTGTAHATCRASYDDRQQALAEGGEAGAAGNRLGRVIRKGSSLS
jgi:hypothetical protein